MRPAWFGITGWILFLAAWGLALSAPWPYNGQSLAALLLGLVGAVFIGHQATRNRTERSKSQ